MEGSHAAHDRRVHPSARDHTARTPRWIFWPLVLCIVAGVAARLFRVDAPLFEYRFYRAMDTAALARNFYEGRPNILYPQVDWRGASTGYAEAEFQAYAYSVAALYRLFGEHLWVGRAFNIGVFVLTAWVLFALTRRLFDDLTGLCAVVAWSCAPLAFYFTRTVQADALIALGVLSGVWFMQRWVDRPERLGSLAASAAGVALAALIKPPYLYVGLPLVWLCQRRFGWGFLKRPILWVYAVACILPCVLWYRWALTLWEHHGNTFGVLGKQTVLEFWGPFDRRWLELARNIALRVANEHATPAGLLLLALGAFLAWRDARARLLWAWLTGFAVYLLAVPRGNNGHDYYQLHLVFLVAIAMGIGAAWLIRRGWGGRAVLSAVTLACLYLSAKELRFMMRPRGFLFARQAFAERVRALTPEGALVIFAVRRPWEPPSLEDYRHRTAEGETLYSDPVDFFLSHRKGYSIDDVQASPEFIETLRQRGARYFATAEAYGPLSPSGRDGVFDVHPGLRTFLDQRYRPLEVTSRHAIYELTSSPPSPHSTQVPAIDPESGGER